MLLTQIILVFRSGEDEPPPSYSEHSLSSIASHDERFICRDHAGSSFQKMYEYYLVDKLTDVTLIAGKYRYSKYPNWLCLQLVISCQSK